MTATDLVIAALATWQAVEIWHHSVLMAEWRARAELWGGWLGGLLACPWCLSVWVAAVVATVLVPLGEETVWGTRIACVGVGFLIGLTLMRAWWHGYLGPWPAITAIVLLLATSAAVAAVDIWRVLPCGVYALAVSRLANLGNDLTHAWCRTPKPLPPYLGSATPPGREEEEEMTIGIPDGFSGP